MAIIANVKIPRLPGGLATVAIGGADTGQILQKLSRSHVPSTFLLSAATRVDPLPAHRAVSLCGRKGF